MRDTARENEWVERETRRTCTLYHECTTRRARTLGFAFQSFWLVL